MASIVLEALHRLKYSCVNTSKVRMSSLSAFGDVANNCPVSVLVTYVFALPAPPPTESPKLGDALCACDNSCPFSRSEKGRQST